MKDRLAELWPNNQPMVMTEQSLRDYGLTIEAAGSMNALGITEIFCIDRAGVHTVHVVIGKVESIKH